MDNKEEKVLEPEVVQENNKKKVKKVTFAWVLLGLAIIWVINPADFDFIPVIGWIDDALVSTAAIANLIVKYKKR